jgi:hypothetical protein
MILGIVGIVLAITGIGIIAAILAIIFGIIGIRRVRHGVATNRGQALTGLITGVIGFVIAASLIGFYTNRAIDCSHKYSTRSDAFGHCVQGDSGY